MYSLKRFPALLILVSVSVGVSSPTGLAVSESTTTEASPSQAKLSHCHRENAWMNSRDDTSGTGFIPRVTFALDPVTNTCYPINGLDHRGPCQGNMKFYQRPDDSEYGLCDCDQDFPNVFSHATGQCHRLFQRDFCPSEHWVEVNSVGKVECKMDPCINFRNASDQQEASASHPLIYFSGKCVNVGESCGNLEEIRLNDSFQPECLPIYQFSVATFGNGLSIPALQCSSGTRWSSLTDSCKKSVSFDFS